jgi:quercetin dioxygenase-like cupin family protein
MQQPDSNAVVRIGALELRFLLDETQGSGDLVIFEFLVPPGARVPEPHYHRSVDEFVYGLEGTLTSTIHGKRRELRPGESMMIPRGAMHHHTNLHDVPAKALVTLNPGSIGRRYFEEIGAAVSGGRPDPAVIAEIMARHGLLPA